MGTNNNNNANKGTRINWINITPLGKESWTDEQKAQAILIKHKDLMATAFLRLNEAQAEDEEMPSQFTLMANHIVDSPKGRRTQLNIRGCTSRSNHMRLRKTASCSVAKCS